MKKLTIILLLAIFSVCFTSSALSQGHAIKFRGNAADQVQAKDSPSLDISGKEFTMESWVYPMGTGAYIIIVNKENSYECALHDGVLMFAIAAPAWKWWGTGNVPLNKWSHIAVTYDGKETTGWINGKKAHTAKENSGNINPTNEPFNIGWRPFDTHYPFNGIIDEVRISKTVRYTKDFEVPKMAFTPDADTAALYHLDEGKGKKTKDDSGNKNEAELIGSPEWVKSDAPFAAAVERVGKLTIVWGKMKQEQVNW